MKKNGHYKVYAKPLFFTAIRLSMDQLAMYLQWKVKLIFKSTVALIHICLFSTELWIFKSVHQVVVKY